MITPSSASTYQAVVLLAPSNISHSHNHNLWMEHALHASRDMFDIQLMVRFYCFFFFFECLCSKRGLGGGVVFKASALVHLTSFGWCVEPDRKTPSWSLWSGLRLIGWEPSDTWRTALATFTKDLWLCSSEKCVLHTEKLVSTFVFVCSKSSLESDPVCTVSSIWSHQIVFESLPLFSFQFVPPPPFLLVYQYCCVNISQSPEIWLCSCCSKIQDVVSVLPFLWHSRSVWFSEILAVTCLF